LNSSRCTTKVLTLWLYYKPQFKQVIDQCDAKTTFKQDWGYVFDRSAEHLKTFCGGIATAFPGALTVEGNFSLVTWEKDYRLLGIADFSLEVMLRATK
jgi:hypothetical protein